MKKRPKFTKEQLIVRWFELQMYSIGKISGKAA